uniref:Uncharacterized protein n=1 Tax=Rhizophagus irregularis (strain DAOM 181602 / DAOM 197198 / MUCL 43194) TaxID=747089 RepID=U9URY2_RHIID
MPDFDIQYELCVTYQPHRNHTFSWINLYNQYLVQINDDPNDLIGPAVDDIQEVDGNDSDEEDDDTPQEARVA